MISPRQPTQTYCVSRQVSIFQQLKWQEPKGMGPLGKILSLRKTRLTMIWLAQKPALSS